MRMATAVLAAALSFSGPAWSREDPEQEQAQPTFSGQGPCANGCLTPVEAVTYASQLGTRAGVSGRFELTVRAVGERDGMIYLNSETDYRDRNCLTIAVAKQLARRVFGSDALDPIRQRLIGRKIVVAGVARQVRIDFTVDGQPTGKYYFQVHARAMSSRQFLAVPPPA